MVSFLTGSASNSLWVSSWLDSAVAGGMPARRTHVVPLDAIVLAADSDVCKRRDVTRAEADDGPAYAVKEARAQTVVGAEASCSASRGSAVTSGIESVSASAT